MGTLTRPKMKIRSPYSTVAFSIDLARMLIDFVVLAVNSQAPYENQNKVIDACAELTISKQESVPINTLKMIMGQGQQNNSGNGPARGNTEI